MVGRRSRLCLTGARAIVVGGDRAGVVAGADVAVGAGAAVVATTAVAATGARKSRVP